MFDFVKTVFYMLGAMFVLQALMLCAQTDPANWKGATALFALLLSLLFLGLQSCKSLRKRQQFPVVG